MSTVTEYYMNPKEDVILFGDQITEGMWVLPEKRPRQPSDRPEDERLRAERFVRVTRLRNPEYAGTGKFIEFIGEWVDGYQEFMRLPVNAPWLVKKTSIR